MMETTHVSNDLTQGIRLARAIIETVAETGDRGAPSGHIYAALMTVGLTLQQYERIMHTLVGLGLLSKRGDLYFVVETD